MKLKESWRHWTADQARSFLRTGPEGKHHLSRQTVVRLLRGMSSVLDVGCGTGVMFELIRDRRLQLDYLGIDVTEKFLEVARNTIRTIDIAFGECRSMIFQSFAASLTLSFAVTSWSIYRIMLRQFSRCTRALEKSSSWSFIYRLDRFVQNASGTNTMRKVFIRIRMILEHFSIMFWMNFRLRRKRFGSIRAKAPATHNFHGAIDTTLFMQ